MSRQKYTLEELIAQCDPSQPLPVFTEWEEMVPVGREIIDHVWRRLRVGEFDAAKVDRDTRGSE